MTTNIQVFSYSKCTTCKKAVKWLDDHNVQYKLIDIVDNPPSKQILANAIEQLGERKKIFNTSGLSYRKHGANVIKGWTDSMALEALSLDGKLLKRPFLITNEGKILVGFKSEVWSEFLLK